MPEFTDPQIVVEIDFLDGTENSRLYCGNDAALAHLHVAWAEKEGFQATILWPEKHP